MELGEPGREVVRSVLSFLELIEVMPNLTRFLREARARGHAAWQVFFDGVDRLIQLGFGVPPGPLMPSVVAGRFSLSLPNSSPMGG